MFVKEIKEYAVAEVTGNLFECESAAFRQDWQGPRCTFAGLGDSHEMGSRNIGSDRVSGDGPPLGCYGPSEGGTRGWPGRRSGLSRGDGVLFRDCPGSVEAGCESGLRGIDGGVSAYPGRSRVEITTPANTRITAAPATR